VRQPLTAAVSQPRLLTVEGVKGHGQRVLVGLEAVFGGTPTRPGRPASCAATFHVDWLNWKAPMYMPLGDTAP